MGVGYVSQPFASTAKPGRTYRPMDDDAREVFARVAAGLGLDHVYAWGSRARGWWVEDSDYDVIVSAPTVDDAVRLRALAVGVAADLGVRIDLFINAPIGADAIRIDAYQEAAA